jgi:rare lipoprotein A
MRVKKGPGSHFRNSGGEENPRQARFSPVSRAAVPFYASRFTALACLSILVGCSTVSGPSQRTSAAPGRGGYYLDDGPGAQVPANLDAIPDAVPRLEPLNRATSRPYSVMGRHYSPMTALAPYRERGVATWYGRRYHGKPTSSGEPYDMYRMTAAHTTLPIPSYARVTNVDNGRSVVVRINDRGPFVGDRLIDVSYVAAHKLDILRNGSATVEVEAIVTPGEQLAVRPSEVPRSSSPGRMPETDPAPTSPVDPPHASVVANIAGHYLQLAAFSVRENAERFVERVRLLLDADQAPIRIIPAGTLYRIHSGPYADRFSAEQAARRIEELLGATPVFTAPR